MANNYQSNINNKLLKSFIKGFESSTVLMNTVSKQLVNDFDASTGGSYGAVSMKRPPQYVPQRTPDVQIEKCFLVFEFVLFSFEKNT